MKNIENQWSMILDFKKVSTELKVVTRYQKTKKGLVADYQALAGYHGLPLFMQLVTRMRKERIFLKR